MSFRERFTRYVFPAAITGLLAGGYLAATHSAASPAGANTLPDRIADTTFWRMFTEMSERGGTFRSDNFVSNETQLQRVIPRLQHEIAPGGVYVGVGPEQNLTYVVALAPKVAFIVDIRRQNALEHLMYKAIIELSANRAEFLSRLYSRPLVKGPYAEGNIGKMIQAYVSETGDTALYRKNFDEMRDHLRNAHGFPLAMDDLASLEYVTRAFFDAGPELTYSMGRASAQGGQGRGPFATGKTLVYRAPGMTWRAPPPRNGGGGGSRLNVPLGRMGMPSFALLMSEDDGTGAQRGFLATEENFQALKDFESRNLLVPIVGDFAGEKALRAVGNYAREHHATVDVFYTSNVEQYLWQQGDDWNRFYKNVATLPLGEHSTFIRSASGGMAYRGNGMRMAQLTMSIAELLKQLHAGQVQSYRDVIGLSH